MGNTGKVALITFGVFVTEAMLHYSIGANKGEDTDGLQFPKGKELVQLLGVVLLFSTINSLIINKIIIK